MNGNKTFPTPEEAVAKGKNDLIETLETNKDLNLEIDLARLKEAQEASLIRHAEIDFEKILNSDSVASLAEIVAADKGMIAPFVLGNQVVGIVEVGEVSDGWKVTGLANKAVREDLNQTGIMVRGETKVTLYEVPNLQLMVYGVEREGGEYYHLNFQRFTIKESVSISEFYPIVREHAIRFNEQFGDQLKREKLLK